MSFLDLLQTVGGRLGILEAPAKENMGELAKVVTRTVTLAELRTEIRSEEVRTLADLPAELTVSFDKIFEAAGVTSSRPGWNVARLKAVLGTEPYRSQERAAAQQALLNLLRSEQIQTEDLVKEAMAQDQALDAFEVFVCKKVEDHMAASEHQITEMDAKIQALQGERTRLEARIQLDQSKLREWRRNKRAYERDLAATIGYLTDRPVITTDDLPE
jgi:chromosome segregation ATPase